MRSENRNGSIVEDGAQALRASELSYRRLFEAARDGILILDVGTGRITDVNPFLVELLGFSRDEMIGKTVGELSPFKDIEDNQAMLERLQQHGYVRYEDLPLETRDGRRIAVEFVSNVYPAGEKKVIQCNIRDITARKKAEERMTLLNACVANSEASLKLFRTLIDRSADAIEVIDPETGRFLDVNERAHQRLGYSREEMLSLRVQDIIDTADSASLQAGMAKLRETGFRIVEARHRRKDGSTFPVEVNIQYIHLNRGYLIAIVRDITDRKQAEMERQLTEARYRTLFDHAPDGIVIADPKSYYIDANPSICRMLGYTRKELVGLHASDIVAESEIQQIEPAISAIQARSDYHREWKFRRKDGSIFGAEVIATIMPDGNLLGMIRDISERKHASEQIAEQAALLDKARDAIVVRDLVGKILFWNKGAERMYGWTSEETKGRFVGGLVYADPKKFEEVNRLTLKQGEWHGELQHLTKKGSEITTEARWALIRDNEGRPKSVLSIDTDITERKKIEAQFMRAQRLESIGTLAGGIAHDLNNILAPS